MKPRILVVDDEAIIRDICTDVLSTMGFDVQATGDPVHALTTALKDNFDLIISDIKMPKMNGTELMKNIRKEKPAIPFIIITGYGTYDMAIDALREGAYDFINKPFRVEELRVSVKNILEKIEISKELSRLQTLSHLFNASEGLVLSRDRAQSARIILESIIKETGASEGIVCMENHDHGTFTTLLTIPDNADFDVHALKTIYAQNRPVLLPDRLHVPIKTSKRNIGIASVSSRNKLFSRADMETATLLINQLGTTLENISLFENLQAKVDQIEDLFLGTVKALSIAIDAKSPWTKGHSERVTDYALMIAGELKFGDEAKRLTELSAILHDIGKIGTYDYLLEKPGKFLPEEYELVKKHPAKGVAILSPISELKDVVTIIRHHHERFDGGGYPEGLQGDAIPFISRVLTVADSYDSMTSDRPYRKTPGQGKAIDELLRCSGSQFDPAIVKAFIKALQQSE